MPKVTLLSYTPEPEKLVAAAAKLCYSSSSPQTLMDGLTPEKTESFLEMLQAMGHESPIEHVSFTFGIEGVSRSLLAQITRHRIASYSVQSQRYVREKDFQYVTPLQIEKIPAALELYEQTMAQIGESYDRLAAMLKEKHVETLMAEGMDEKAAGRKAEKMAIEDARFVLPNACDTQMVVTMNARSLYNFFRHRCCNRAQWEIREVAYQMLALVHTVAPTLFQSAGAPCICGNCPEGKMSCGHPDEVRAYDAMRKGNATR
ncbi:MAG: FAD-dependent thymidylate synthase [Oscillospiraceae bacterium]|nr:FAD-dependent thymidylate synthase [Oscillospiraceae bacterium]